MFAKLIELVEKRKSIYSILKEIDARFPECGEVHEIVSDPWVNDLYEIDEEIKKHIYHECVAAGVSEGAVIINNENGRLNIAIGLIIR